MSDEKLVKEFDAFKAWIYNPENYKKIKNLAEVSLDRRKIAQTKIGGHTYL
ncbi:hypothetical protein [Methanosarcina horonobensis]|uniref:hypothetical protein n=1 Tax=Methanosarcina horonobensis TaxID=418008 RepID=UPI0022B8BE19|nr:hypothetical protein [Methanosarcina horonobensis]